MLADLVDPARDLLLGTTCVGCERPGRLVCRACALLLEQAEPAPAWPTPVPTGLVDPWAAASYDGLARALVLGLKERGQLSLVAPQAVLLAAAAQACLARRDDAATTALLVPVPSRRRTVRARGHDATAAVARATAARLRSAGIAAQAVSLLRLRPGVLDQSGLDASARRANLSGSMTCPDPGLRRCARRWPGPVRVLVCDDVVTTGSTLVEAQRALRAVGLPVVGAASVAATRLRRAGPGPLDRSPG